MKTSPLIIFSMAASAKLGAAIATALGQPLAAHEEREFEDGEHKARPLDSVSGADVYVVQSLHGGPDQSVNDKLCRLLFFIGAVNDVGAARVTAITPYLCYARKDRRTKPNDPVTTRYVAGMFESIGTDCVVTLEVHNPTDKPMHAVVTSPKGAPRFGGTRLVVDVPAGSSVVVTLKK
jgi:ribose-phosphate pyrophosphokinase